jgi:hypothetical protein
MKAICLFVNLLLITALTGYAQTGFLLTVRKQKQNDSLKLQPFRLLPENYYSTHIGFFCRKELQLEKITKIPFRIRLGNLDYVNTLEGKNKKVMLPNSSVPANTHSY